MPDDKPPGGSLSVLDSALIIAAVSAACYIMGHAARLGTSRRLRVPVMLMPDVGPEIFVLVGGIYLVMLAAVGLLGYFVYVLVDKRTTALRRMIGPVLLSFSERSHQHPRTYFLLAALASLSLMYSVPMLLPFTPRSAGGPSAFGGRDASDVVKLALVNPEADLIGRTLRYLWRQGGFVVLQDKQSGELVLVAEGQVRVLMLAAPGGQVYGANPLPKPED